MANVLGICVASEVQERHDTGAALVKDGKLIAAVEEERFTRKKHETAPPVLSVKYCLAAGGLTMDDIDGIAIMWRDVQAPYADVLNAVLRYNKAKNVLLRKLGTDLKKLAGGYRDPQLDFLREYSRSPPVTYYEHHLTHAATAFYPSGFKDAAIVTVDGTGEWNSTVAWKGGADGITKLKEKPNSQSLGFFYSAVTKHIRMGSQAEGKTMGLAPYGKHDPDIYSRLTNFINPNKGEWYEGATTRDINQADLGFPQRLDSEKATSEKYANLAYNAQEILEEALLKVSKWTVDETGCKNICLSGGVALNCTTNSRIINAGFADDIFIFPAANDGGTAIGAALQLAEELGDKTAFRMESPYWGPEFTDEQIEEALKESGATFEETGDPSGSAADLIAKGKIICWFQGRMEIGPRALGNRSILADPTRTDVWERVNEVKLREQWRPLAPSMLYEAKDEYLENARDSPFMILAFQVPKNKHKEIPAVVHVDGSTRPQTVKKTTNEKYWNLIKKLEQNNGTPVTMNTSFNVGPEPIVCTPKDAIRTFRNSKLDALVIGSYVLQK
jgi:carbamoyltransferase